MTGQEPACRDRVGTPRDMQAAESGGTGFRCVAVGVAAAA